MLVTVISFSIFAAFVWFVFLHFLTTKKTVYVVKITSEISYDSLKVDELVKFLNSTKADGFIFYINSPGGDVLASYKIAKAVSRLKVPTVCYIKEYGASGAYWIASQCDKIVAEPFAITGSIGVTMSYLEFSGLLKKLGINYTKIVAGKYKDIGSPFRNLTREEKRMLQKKLEIVMTYFKKDILKKRPFINKTVFNGMFYLGIEAKKLGLVDEIGDFDVAKKDMAKMLNVSENDLEIKYVNFEIKKSLLDVLLGNEVEDLIKYISKLYVIKIESSLS